MLPKVQQHRKVVSNFTSNDYQGLRNYHEPKPLQHQIIPTQSYLTKNNFVKPITKPQNQILMNQLDPYSLFKKVQSIPFNQSYSQIKQPLPDSNPKRIRTEENEKRLLEFNNNSPPKFLQPSNNPDYLNVYREDTMNSSVGKIPDQQKSQNSIVHSMLGCGGGSASQKKKTSINMNNTIKNLLAQKSTRELKKHRLPAQILAIDFNSEMQKKKRENRNQSADFQMLLKPTGQKKKYNSQGSILNEQAFFTQREGSEKLQHQDYYREFIKRREWQKSINQNTNPQIDTTPKKMTIPQIQEIILALKGQGKQFQSSSAGKTRTETLNIQATQKKQPQTINPAFEDSGKVLNNRQTLQQRVRTENSMSIPMSRHSLIREQSEEEQEHQYLQFYEQNPNEKLRDFFTTTKQLEKKIDLMCQEINSLKQKSEQLEAQNQLLFDNLNRVNTEKETSSQERLHLLVKLDQMIDMQKRQEENLNFFRNIFQCNSDSRRIKTDFSQSFGQPNSQNAPSPLHCDKEKIKAANSSSVKRAPPIKSEHLLNRKLTVPLKGVE